MKGEISGQVVQSIPVSLFYQDLSFHLDRREGDCVTSETVVLSELLVENGLAIRVSRRDQVQFLKCCVSKKLFCI